MGDDGQQYRRFTSKRSGEDGTQGYQNASCHAIPLYHSAITAFVNVLTLYRRAICSASRLGLQPRF